VTAPTNVVDLTVEQVEHEWRVHALGSFLVSRAVIPHMRERGGGSIVMISSIGAAIFAPRHAPYTMAKSALEALARTIAKEEREHGIRVNIVAPGVTDTEMTRALLEHSGVTDIRTLDATSPFGHVCTAEEVAHVVRFVVSPESSYLNDQRITIDGGTF
jgi:NAD(P)-dependent dehydrogenase (short-subunit alcohol dehydrogenase family)